jgi:mono/diheme cytochrome c family protein
VKSKMNKSSLKSLFVILSGLVALCAAFIFIFSIAPLAQARSLAQSTQDGQAIFQQKCAACHTIGGGKLVGPDLQGVTQRRDLAWIKKFISAPDQVLSSGDPLAQQLLAESNNVPMPNLGLTPADVDALVAYLENPGDTAGLASAPALPVGDALQGERLFNGAASLANGGTSCIACHSVAGMAALGGGTLGPDLTQVFTRYGAAGLQGALSGLPFPTMQGSFANRPLTPQEQADLYAYFEKANQAAAPALPMTTWFLVISAIGAVVLFALMLIFWPRQRQSLSDALRQKA